MLRFRACDICTVWCQAALRPPFSEVHRLLETYSVLDLYEPNNDDASRRPTVESGSKESVALSEVVARVRACSFELQQEHGSNDT